MVVGGSIVSTRSYYNPKFLFSVNTSIFWISETSFDFGNESLQIIEHYTSPSPCYITYPSYLLLCFCRTAIVLGSAIPLALFLIWNAVILGTITSPEMGSNTFADPLQLLRSTNGVVGVSNPFFIDSYIECR